MRFHLFSFPLFGLVKKAKRTQLHTLPDTRTQPRVPCPNPSPPRISNPQTADAAFDPGRQHIPPGPGPSPEYRAELGGRLESGSSARLQHQSRPSNCDVTPEIHSFMSGAGDTRELGQDRDDGERWERDLTSG